MSLFSLKFRGKRVLTYSLLLYGLFVVCAVVYSYNQKFFFSLQKAVIKKGVLFSDPQKTYPGLTLYPVTTKFTKEEIKKDNRDFDSSGVVLIDAEGRVVHRWTVYAERARLLPNCNLMVMFGMKSGINTNLFPEIRKEHQRHVLLELDWSGEVVRKYQGDFSKNARIHHDFQVLDNGHILFALQELLPDEYFDRVTKNGLKRRLMLSDSIVEINNHDEIVWRWDAYDHFDLNYCGRKGCPDFPMLGSSEDWLHINAVSTLGPNKWFDAGDKTFHPDNIIVMARNWWEALIISKETGEVVWTYSGDYKGGIGGGHEAHMIPEGYPGEGNILIFDNGSKKNHENESYVLEVNPVTKKVVWVFDVGDKLYSKARGSARRLANGNTLISEDDNARLIEVTKDKEIVWEFKGRLLGYKAGTRASKYGHDYCEKLGSFKDV